jgi:hypothetical protein
VEPGWDLADPGGGEDGAEAPKDPESWGLQGTGPQGRELPRETKKTNKIENYLESAGSEYPAENSTFHIWEVTPRPGKEPPERIVGAIAEHTSKQETLTKSIVSQPN